MASRLLVLVLLVAAPAGAQSTAECATAADCPASVASSSPAAAQLWADAAAVHQHKLTFVAALQQFIRAQAGTFGDEGDALRAGPAAMREALSAWDLAVQRFVAAAGRLPPGAESHLALATVFLDRHRLAEALRELSRAEEQDDRRPSIYTLRALALDAAGRPADAVRALRRAVALAPEDAAAAYSLAAQLAALGDADGASRAWADLQRLLRRQPTRPPDAPFARLGLVRQLADAAPIFPRGRYAGAFAALEGGDYAQAVAQLAEAVAGDPLVTGHAAVREGTAGAAAAIRDGRLATALEQLHALASTAPEDSEVQRLLGLTYWLGDQPGRSLEHLRNALRAAPGDERSRLLLVDVLAGERRLAEAQRELELALDGGLASGELHYRRARLFEEQSLLPQATAAYRESTAFGPVAGRDHFFQSLGAMLVNQADFDGAVSAYRERIAANPNSGLAHRQLGEVYFLQGRHEEALGELLVAVWLDPGDARAHAAAGQVQLRLLRYVEAEEAFQAALALDGELREPRYGLGTALLRQGRADEARAALDRFGRQQAEAEALGRREFQLDALRRDAAARSRAGDHQGALAAWTDAAQLDPGSARSHRDLGLALLRVRRAADAALALERAQQIDETAQGAADLAEAYAAAGDAARAAGQRARAQALVQEARLARIRALAR